MMNNYAMFIKDFFHTSAGDKEDWNGPKYHIPWLQLCLHTLYPVLIQTSFSGILHFLLYFNFVCLMLSLFGLVNIL